MNFSTLIHTRQPIVQACRRAASSTRPRSAAPSTTIPRAASQSRRWATSTTLSSSPTDPAEIESQKALEEGTKLLEEDNMPAAQAMYKRSVEIRPSASGLFNLGVTYYHGKDYPAAIQAWNESVELEPSSPDTHTNLASAYIMSIIPRPDLSLKHLRIASSLSPDDPEICFNLAAVLEACGNLEEALKQYTKAQEYGITRAGPHIRNVSAKILGKKMNEVEAEMKKQN